MKNRILCLILALVLLPILPLVSACDKKSGYDISLLKEEFFSITKEEDDNIVIDNNKIVFVYSRHKVEDKEILTQNIEDKNLPYRYLTDYNEIFLNLMDFSCGHVGYVSSTDKNISEEVRNNIKTELDQLQYAIASVDTSIDLLAEALKLSSNSNSTMCIERYKNLLREYENLFQKAIIFTNRIANVYYSIVLYDSNPNISEISAEDFDANLVVNKLKGRISYQISNLTQVFVERNICGGSLPEKIVANSEEVVNFNAFKDEIAKLKINLSEEEMSEKANGEAIKSSFYNLSVKAYNLQEILNADSQKFATAARNVAYIEIKGKEDITTEQKIYINIIDGYDYLLQQYNEVLIQMIDMINK